MWLDERLRVVSLQVDPERTVNHLPGFGPVNKGVAIVQTDSRGVRTVLTLPEQSVEATRLLDSQDPLPDTRQEAIRQRMLNELRETIEDPNCPTQACTASAIKRKYRQQMELTIGRSD